MGREKHQRHVLLISEFLFETDIKNTCSYCNEIFLYNIKYKHGRIMDFMFCFMFMKEVDLIHSALNVCCFLKQMKMFIHMNRPGYECGSVFVLVVCNVLKFALYTCYSLIWDMIIVKRDLIEGYTDCVPQGADSCQARMALEF